jgi:hypothetical protein
MDTGKVIAVQSEVMLLAWAESSTRGRTVTLLLPEGHEEHPFKRFAMKSGKRAGQRFMAVFVEIGDDEQPVEQHEPARHLSQTAAALCKDAMFHRFADERCFDTIHDEDSARCYILTGCGITSRRQLDSNKPAADYFRNHILIPFLEYKKTVEGVL